MTPQALQSRGDDLFVLIPGITGSILRKDGKDLWALSGGGLINFARSLGRDLDQLRLAGDDPALDDLGDGITAPGIIEGITLLPGVHKCDSFALLRSFLFEIGLAQSSSLVPFAYDWRRDNRVSARKLQRLVEERLQQRYQQGAANARVVLIAHSMGGLVARYYLEVLGGWRKCRALVTFGTPHRGSVKILDFLANGYKLAFVDLTEVVRSCTSAYQLLPIYPAVEVEGQWKRVGEMTGLKNIEPNRAALGLAFHREIEDAQAMNQKDPSYSTDGYSLIPVIGTGQPTLQSARLHDGRLMADGALPPGFAAILDGGDGSVPRASAIPLEMSNGRGPLLYVAERHGTLHGRREILEQMYENVRQAGIDLTKIRAVKARESAPKGLSMALEDAYPDGEPVFVSVQSLGLGRFVGDVIARLQPLPYGNSQSLTLRATKEGWTGTLDTLSVGAYHIEIRARGAGGVMISSVSDLFEVIAR